MTTNVFPEDIIFNLSKLKFTFTDNSGNQIFNFSLIKDQDKTKIESLPPGTLPDKMVLDIRQLTSEIHELVYILKVYKSKIDLSENVDVGNDIEYAIRELPKFKSRIKLLINDAAKKMSKDIFDNVYAGFGKYRYIEFLFSPNYKNIISIRLLGNQRRARKRFTIFNIPNENLDSNIINLVYRRKSIIKNYATWSSDDTINAYEFISKTFVPIPPFHKKPSWLPGPLGSAAGFIDNLVKDISPKTYQALLDNQNFNSLSTKQQFYEASQKLAIFREFEDSPLFSSMSNGDEIKSIKDGFTNPLDCIMFLWNGLFINLLSCEFLVEIAKLAIKQSGLVDEFFRNMSLIQLFDAIDKLPPNIRGIVYLNLVNEQLGLDIDRALSAVDSYISSFPKPQRRLNCEDPTSLLEKYYLDLSKGDNSAGLSSIFRQLKQDYPDNYSDIQRVFDDNFSRDAIAFIVKCFADLLMAIDFCNFKLNLDFKLPNFKIPDLWFDFSFDLKNLLLGLICEFLSSIFELFFNMLTNLGRLDDFFSQFLADENVDSWSQYLDYAFYLVISSSRVTPATVSPRSPNDSLRAARTAMSPLLTPEGKSFIQSKVTSTFANSPLSPDFDTSQAQSRQSNAPCNDIKFNSSRNRLSDDIEYEIPSLRKQNNSLINPAQTSSTTATVLSQTNGGSSVTQQANLTPSDVLEKIKFFTYCKKYDFFTISGAVEPLSIEVLKEISSNSPQLFESDLISNVATPRDKQELSESLKNMFKQIQSVLSKRELSDLINNNYSEEVASVVRIIAKINFPNLTNNLDPIKYFTMLGKVIGRTIKELQDSDVIA